MPKLLIDKTDTDNKNISVTQPYTSLLLVIFTPLYWIYVVIEKYKYQFQDLISEYIMHALRLYGNWISSIRLKVRGFCSLCSAHVLQNWSGANQKEIQCFFLQSYLSGNQQLNFSLHIHVVFLEIFLWIFCCWFIKLSCLWYQ